MGNMYPYVESMKVLAAYAALLYIWPSIIFRRRLKGTGLTFRFAFCSTVQIVLLNGAVLGLGLLHILNVWVMRAAFWGALAVSAGIPLLKKKRNEHRTKARSVKNLMMVNCGWKIFLVHKIEKPLGFVKKEWQNYKGRLPEYFILTVILLFGMAFFSNGAFQESSYGCMDQYTHHTWILGLLE